MNSNLKRQSYIVIGLVLTVAVSYLLFAFFPRMRTIACMRREIHEQQKFVSQAERKRPLIETQRKQRESIAAVVTSQRDRLVAADRVSHLFSQISTLTKAAGTRTTRFQPMEALKFDTFKQVPVQLGVSGNTEAVADLVRQIENLPHTIWINGMKLNASGETGELTRCELELEVFVDNREISD